MLRAVKTGLERRGEAMRAMEVLHAVQLLLGRAVYGSSVGNCLVDHAQGPQPHFERLANRPLVVNNQNFFECHFFGAGQEAPG